LALLNLDIIHPYLIIIDDYFSNRSEDNWMENIVEQIGSTTYDCPIFCLSPRYSFTKNNHSIGAISYCSFNGNFTTRLNFALGIEDQNTNQIYKS